MMVMDRGTAAAKALLAFIRLRPNIPAVRREIDEATQWVQTLGTSGP
jgi:hypothetical protein